MNIKRRPSLRKQFEYFAFLMFFLAVFVSAFVVVERRWTSWAGDAAQLYNILDHIHRTGKPMNSIFPSIIKATQTWGESAQFICALPFPRPSQVAMDHFRVCHPYFILYSLAPLARWFPIDHVIAAVSVFAIFGLLFAVYGFLRLQRVGPWPSLLFSLAVTAHPAWSFSWIGQPYVDRFFYLPGFLLMAAASIFPRKIWLIFIFMLACCSLNDRIAFMSGACLMLYAALAPGWDRRTRLKVGGVGALGFIFGLYLLKFYVRGYWHTTAVVEQVASLHGIWDMLVAFSTETWTFLLLNFVGFGFLGWFFPRALLIAFCAAVPNLLITVGGAEKVGWATHYHSLYFPILVWAVALGFVRLYRSGTGARRLSIAWMSAVGVYLTLAVAPQKVSGLWVGHFPSLGTSTWAEFWRGLSAPRSQFIAGTQKLDEVLPKGIEVSAPEGAMPTLIKERRVLYFPVGLDQVDFAVMIVIDPKLPPEQRYLGAFTTRSSGEQEKLNRCIFKRMKETGWDVDHPQIADAWAIFKRRPHSKL